MTWENVPVRDNDPGIWVDGLFWDDDELWNDGWEVVAPVEEED